MASDADSGSVSAARIAARASIITAAISVVGTVVVTLMTGHFTTPSDTREAQKTKQENARLLQEKEGLKEENAGLRQEITGLKQQNASLNDEVAQARPDPSHDSQAQEPPAAANSTTEKVDDFVSQLDGCQKNTNGVTCVVRVMNTKEDRVVRLYNDWTSIVDSTGNEQKVKVATLGASTSPSPFYYAETNLPTNVFVRALVTFGRVDLDVSRLSILTLGIQIRGVPSGMPDREQIQFRGIPLLIQR